MNYKKIGIAIGIFLLCVVAGYFVFRNSILQWAFNRSVHKAANTYHLQLSANKVAFSGFDVVSVDGITIQPQGADTLLRLKHARVDVALLSLLKGSIAFDGIEADSGALTIYNFKDSSNIKFAKRTGSTDSTQVTKGEAVPYSDIAKSLYKQLNYALGTSFAVTEMNVSYADSGYTTQVHIPSMNYDRKNLSAIIINPEINDTLTVTGEVLQKGKRYSYALNHTGKAATYLAFLSRPEGPKFNFNTIQGEVQIEPGSEFILTFNGNATNLHMYHWRLAQEDVVFDKLQGNAVINITDDKVELDSASTITVNSTPVKLFAQYQRAPQQIFTYSITMPEVVADTFFTSLPGGMFNTLKGISATGTLAYRMYLQLPLQQPDSLIFDSKMTKKDFRITRFGKENYTRINGTFDYEAMDKDRLVRMITVGYENPSFTPIGQISPYLIGAVLQSEDPSFLQHRGFLEEAFRESIIKNYKEKRFARGGSTISMQLVKNVFLSRDKTVSRKAEEALIVYLIENTGLVSKERMLEVYLNVIEWGPNIYGIGEASRFYFNKKPAALNLNESVFLSAIIPNPKYYKYHFTPQGDIKPYFANYFNVLSRRMVFRGRISPSDTINFIPSVQLRGPALNSVLPADSPDRLDDMMMGE